MRSKTNVRHLAFLSRVCHSNRSIYRRRRACAIARLESQLGPAGAHYFHPERYPCLVLLLVFIRLYWPLCYIGEVVYWLWPDSWVWGSARRAPLGYVSTASHLAHTTPDPSSIIHHHTFTCSTFMYLFHCFLIVHCFVIYILNCNNVHMNVMLNVVEK